MAQSLSKLYVHIIFHVKNERLLIRQEDEKELYAYIGVDGNTTDEKVS